jgi:hypothetical protein
MFNDGVAARFTCPKFREIYPNKGGIGLLTNEIESNLMKEAIIKRKACLNNLIGGLNSNGQRIF